MKQTQFNFLNMLSGVLNGLNSERPVWENESEIVSLYDQLESEHNRIISLDGALSATDLTGYTAQKDNTFDQLIASTYKLAKKMSAYAKKNNIVTLLPLINISYSTLSRGPELEAVNRCAGIADKASELIDNLSSFKVTEAEIEAVRQLIEDYRKHAAERIAASKDKPVKGSEISQLLSNLRTNLDIMDDLVKGLIDDQGFIARYKSWRSIVDYGKGKTLKNKAVENQ
jgi:uncharacterized protein YeeX (DUF496 family)